MRPLVPITCALAAAGCAAALLFFELRTAPEVTALVSASSQAATPTRTNTSPGQEPSLRSEHTSLLLTAREHSATDEQIVQHTPVPKSESAEFQNLLRTTRTVLGLEEDRGLGARSGALRSLPDHLAEADLFALYDFLLDPNRAPDLTPVQERVLVNDIMKKLRHHADGAPDLGYVLEEIYRNSAGDAVIRDYAIQHLGSWLERQPYSEKALAVMWDAAQEETTATAGTALLSLHRIGRAHPDLDMKKLGETAELIARDPNAAVAARVTALGLAATLDTASILPTARQIAAGKTTVALQAAAVSILGDRGSLSDLQLLRSLQDDEAVACTAALEAAIGKIQRRFNTDG